MSHTYINHIFHVVFSTKGRRRYLSSNIKDRLHGYITSTAKAKEADVLAINGTDDHVHLLIKIPARILVPDLIRVIKSNSSKWVSDEFSSLREFKWQSGYSSFSVSESAVNSVANYIEDQVEHHKKRTFKEELKILLIKNGIEFDEKFFLD